MTRTFPPGQDFKQMLVISVSIHLMAMITLLFIPKAEYKPEIVIPSFFINLKELPGSPAEKLRSPVQPSPIKISKAEKNVAPRKPREKKAPTPPVSPPSILKPIAQKSESVKLLEQLETISPSKKPSPLLKELDRIAKTEIKKIAPPKKKGWGKKFS